MTPDFWRSRRVFVTGHTGFKGAWLCLCLHRLGAEVTGFALPPQNEPNLFELAGLNRYMNSVFGDITDQMSLKNTLTETKPEIVMHLAAQALVRRSYEHPLETLRTNVMGTAHLLEACRTVGELRAIVNVTSDKCYANREWIWSYRETDDLGGDDPYSASKACAELVTAAYRESFFRDGGDAGQQPVGIATARAGNVIGGGDFGRDRLLPDLVRAAVDGQPALIRFPDAVRPWQHVLDSLGGYLRLAEFLWSDPLSFSTAWNFGPVQNDARSVRWIAERFKELWPADFSWQVDPATQPNEAQILSLDSSQARNRLAWRPRLDPEGALQWALDWYCAVHQDPSVVTERTCGQIDDYLGMAPRS
ncbi:MAG TPA: CDP-glucose 4,6-dehydratase [Gammaproteobacteria bacterium]